MGGIPYPKIFGLPTKDVSASDYVRDMAAEDAEIGAQPYVFHSINGPEDELLNAFPMFPDFLQVLEASAQCSVPIGALTMHCVRRTLVSSTLTARKLCSFSLDLLVLVPQVKN